MRGEEDEVCRREEEAGEDRRSLGPVLGDGEYVEERRSGGGEIEEVVAGVQVAKARQATQARL
jgi:hypothetical protein